jgi:glyoxylase-like metal-dependent hydrolase (beta-lactamase superfamily II)
MNYKISSLFFWLVIILFILSCSTSENLIVLRQKTGPIDTNCYLLYDVKSKEAALFDVGGPIDSLITHIKNKNLKLKYIFATHCHMDHIEGIPEIMDRYPDALLCYNKEDYEEN